ncbi:MAG TPA: acylphosphatase [Methanoculleus sp.]|nr:acylphosphatase [Methanoculleus sp.]
MQVSPDTSQNAGFSRNNATITLKIEISGHVQNIGFRACARKIAVHLGVTGEVMNLAGGAVLITARGEAFVLEKFISMLYGCPRAVIRGIATKEVDTGDFSDFMVRRGLFSK